MKDIVRKVIASMIALGGLATIGIYMQQGTMIVKDYVAANAYYALGGVALVFLVIFLQFGIVVLPGKWLKFRGVILGIILILLAYYFLVNDAAAGIYAGDIIALLGVLTIYLTLAGVIVTKQAEKKIATSKQTIIEV